MILKKTVLLFTALALMTSQDILPSVTLTAGQVPLTGLWVSPTYRAYPLPTTIATSNTGVTSPVTPVPHIYQGYSCLIAIEPNNLAAINKALLSNIPVKIEQSAPEYGDNYNVIAASNSTGTAIGTLQTYTNLFAGGNNGNVTSSELWCELADSTYINVTNPSLATFEMTYNPTAIATLPASASTIGKSVQIPVITSPATPPISSFNFSPVWTGNKSAAGYAYGECNLTDPLLTQINKALLDGTTVLISSMFVPSVKTPAFLDFQVTAYNSATKKAIGKAQKLSSTINNVTAIPFIPSGSLYSYANSGYIGTPGSAWVMTDNIVAGTSLELIPQAAAPVQKLPDSSTLTGLWISIIGQSTPAVQLNCKVDNPLFGQITTALKSGNHVTISPAFSGSSIILTAQEIISSAVTNPIGTQTYSTLPAGLTASTWTSSSATYQYTNSAGITITGPLVPLALNQPLEIVQAQTATPAKTQIVQSLSVNPVWTGNPDPTTGKMFAKCPIGAALMNKINATLAKKQNVYITSSISGSNFIVTANTYDINTASGYLPFGTQAFDNLIPSGSKWAYSNFQSQFTNKSLVNTNNFGSSYNALGIYKNKTIKSYQWPNLSKAK